MNLEDMSTKDLERLYHKHFGKKSTNSGYTPKMQQEDNERFKLDINELRKRKPGSVQSNPNKEDDDIIREMADTDSIFKVDPNAGDYVDANIPSGRGRVLRRVVDAPPDSHSHVDPKEYPYYVINAEGSGVPIHIRKEEMRVDKFLEQMSTKDLRNLYLKSLRMKYKSNEGVNDIRRAEERTANSQTDALGRNRSADPNKHERGKEIQDFDETPRKVGDNVEIIRRQTEWSRTGKNPRMSLSGSGDLVEDAPGVITEVSEVPQEIGPLTIQQEDSPFPVRRRPAGVKHPTFETDKQS